MNSTRTTTSANTATVSILLIFSTLLIRRSSSSSLIHSPPITLEKSDYDYYCKNCQSEAGGCIRQYLGTSEGFLQSSIQFCRSTAWRNIGCRFINLLFRLNRWIRSDQRVTVTADHCVIANGSAALWANRHSSYLAYAIYADTHYSLLHSSCLRCFTVNNKSHPKQHFNNNSPDGNGENRWRYR